MRRWWRCLAQPNRLASLAAGLSGLAAFGASVAAPAQTAAPVAEKSPTLALQVLAVQVLSSGPVAGAPRLELSDLAWDAARRQLLAVSDRGRLHVYAGLPGAFDTLEVRPLYRQTLPGRPNLEAMALDPEGHLHLIDEPSGRVTQWVRAGAETWRPVEGEAATGRGTARSPARSGHGIEGAMWLPEAGLAVARQHLVDGLHRIVADSGRVWTLRPTGTGATLKALARLDADRLLALEKLRRPGPDGFVLRAWSASCDGAAPCPTQDLQLHDTRIEPRDNFEGLTCLGDGRCLLVTDDGGSADERSLLVLVRIQALATPGRGAPPRP